ncbi:MAG TPA: glutamate--tRNA ligase [Bacilli bacterium]
MTEKVRLRYAPSPTGHLHIGGARTALFCYLTAKHEGGQFIVRFEDTDQTRHVETGVQSQLDGLKWLGIEWDESVDIGGPYGPYRQMERLHLYRPFTEKLLAAGHAYYCYCTPEELEKERKEQEAQGLNPMYSGKCRHLTAAERERLEREGRIPSIRFRVPENETIQFADKVRGTVAFDTNGIGDFILVRPDGIPTYNYAVVLDDHLMGITFVIRGEEHLTNTPRQILLYRALGFAIPQFAHLSLILNQDRKKMSKRDESVMQFIEQYREQGYLPEAMLNFIALLGWSPVGETELFNREELIAQFDISRFSKSPAVFDTDKLNWMSNQYIRKADVERIAALTLPHLRKAGYIGETITAHERERIKDIVGLYQEQLNCAADIVQAARTFFVENPEMEAEAKAVLAEEHAPAVVESFLKQVETAASLDAEQVKGLLKNVQRETGYKGKQLFMSVRAAVTGQTHGRDLNETIRLLGKERVMRRLQAALQGG